MSRFAPRGRDAYPHFTTITTRWSDNDAYGHVNNTVYYQWFDSAVNALLVGTGLLDIAHGDPIGLVVETGCTFFAPLSFPGDVDVGVAIDRVGGSSVTYCLGIFAAGAQRAAAQGHFIHVYVARQSRRPVPLPAEWRKKLATLG